jgi:hypothetical protein
VVFSYVSKAALNTDRKLEEEEEATGGVWDMGMMISVAERKEVPRSCFELACCGDDKPYTSRPRRSPLFGSCVSSRASSFMPSSLFKLHMLSLSWNVS